MVDQMIHGRIVVGVDGSPHSVAALRWAMRQAVLTGAQLDAVGCWQRPQYSGYPAPSWIDSDFSEPTGKAVRAAVDDAVGTTTGAADLTRQATAVEGAAVSVC